MDIGGLAGQRGGEGAALSDRADGREAYVDRSEQVWTLPRTRHYDQCELRDSEPTQIGQYLPSMLRMA